MSDMNRANSPLFIPYHQRPIISRLSLNLPILIICFISLNSLSYADECGRIIPLYQDSLKQFEVAHKSYLEAGCTEGNQSKNCKRLGAAVREIQGVVHMFTLRLKSLSCTLQKRIESPCERLLKMIYYPVLLGHNPFYHQKYQQLFFQPIFSQQTNFYFLFYKNQFFYVFLIHFVFLYH